MKLSKDTDGRVEFLYRQVRLTHNHGHYQEEATYLSSQFK
jgi:hypothetical protein